ncbi:hypothetical protein CAC42_6570 [Sphaceloma murrayae]|uniref:DUF1279 domain-containing protein n=1 Tax=Sphaceloma murrayae TaxID=2082308 RepID=A0A2K1QFT8_9PEZI|nr:hypothetical protein CAC42_6570 [Sphaceloma murrayae]
MSVSSPFRSLRAALGRRGAPFLFRAIHPSALSSPARRIHAADGSTWRWCEMSKWCSRRPSALMRSLRTRRHYSEQNTPSPNPTAQLGSPEPQSLSQRMRKLSREYGWSALGVYLLLSAADFPFCYLLVRVVGTDRIGHIEHLVVSAFWRAVEYVIPDWIDKGKAVGEGEDGDTRENWGVEKAQEANKGESASLWTQLALAYAIHKSFIFVRVPLTAAVTPKVVKTLRGWGWNIGKRTPKPKKVE